MSSPFNLIEEQSALVSLSYMAAKETLKFMFSQVRVCANMNLSVSLAEITVTAFIFVSDCWVPEEVA